MLPDWESNPQPFGLQAGTQSTEPHQPGQKKLFFNKKTIYVRYLEPFWAQKHYLGEAYGIVVESLSSAARLPVWIGSGFATCD